jgi:PAS domain S-box-containing protein
MKARNDNLLGRLQNLPPATATTIFLVYLAVVGIADFYLPAGMRFAVLYVLGVAFIAWCAGPRLALAGAVLTSGLSVTVELTSGQPDYGFPIRVWNETSRCLLFVATGWLIARAGVFARQLNLLVEERTTTLRLEAEQHKATAADLAETVERFAQVVNNITEVFWLSDVGKHQIMYISPGYERIWGRRCEELYRDSRSWVAALHPDDREPVFRRALTEQAGGQYDVEYRIIRPDGDVRWIRDRAFPVRNPQGEVYRIAGIAEDITERKRTQEVLQTQAAILENMAEGVVVTDEQGLIVQMNPAAERIWGYECNEVIGQPASIFSALPEPEATAVLREVLRTLQATASWRGVFNNRRKDGTLIVCEAVISRLEIQGRVLMVAVQQEITERKRAEQTLRQSEETLRALLNAISDPAFLMDKDARVLVHNPALALAVGAPGGDLNGKCIFSLLPPDLATSRKLVFDHVLQSRQPVQFEDVHYGRTFMNFVNPVLDAAGNVTRVAVFALEITERKQAETALREANDKLEQRVRERTTELQLANKALSESEARLQLALDASDAGTWSWDATTNTSQWDDRYHKMYGLDPAVPRSFEAWITRVHPVDRQRLVAQIQKLQEHGADSSWDEEFRVLHPVKGERWMAGLGRIDRDEAGRAVCLSGINLDITERKRAAEALRSQLAYIETIYQNVPVGLCVVDLDFRYVRINERLAAMNGIPVEQHLGRTMREVVPHLAQAVEAVCRQVIATGQPVLHLEVDGVTDAQPGVRRTWVSSWVPLKQADGRVIGVSLLVEEVTARKHAEEAQRAQLEYIETIYQTAPVGLCALDADFRYLRINEVLAAMNGKPVAEHIGRTVREMVPHLADGTETVCRQVLATGQPVLGLELEGATDARQGIRRSWVTHWVPLKQADGRASGISVLVEEVTERKRIEQALRESEVKYRRLFESMTDAFVQVDMTGRIIEFNPAYQAMLGYAAEELGQLTFSGLTPEKWHAFEAQIVAEQILARGYSDVYEKEYRRKDGTVFPAELRTFLLRNTAGQPTGMWAIVRDISRRKQTEKALREAWDQLEARVQERTAELQEANRALHESEERYRSLVTNLNVGVYRNQPGLAGGFVQANPALARLHGYDSVEEFQTVKVADLYQDPLDREEFLADVQRQGILRSYELRLKKKDGTPIYASVNATAHLGPDGEVEWIDGTLEDITERKKAQEALRASEERYRALAESSPDAIFILDRDIRVQYVNARAAALWRRRPQDLIGLTQAELFSPEAAQRQASVVSSVFETGNAIRRERPMAFPVGDQWIEIRLVPLYDARSTVTSVMGICRDITERKRAEQQLAETLDLNQKMIAASSMGIAAYKASGECVFANEALARIVGGSVSEVLQGNFSRLESWRESGLLQMAEEALSQQQVRRGEVYATTRFGKRIWLDCHLASFVSNGQSHLLFMALDISERKRAEEALKMQSLVLQNMAEGALLLAPDQTILFANTALEAMFGYDPGELMGKPVSVLNAWPPEETARFNQVVMRATESGKVWQGQYENRRKDGTLFATESRVIRLALGGEDHFVSVQQDITDRKRAESLLQAQRDLAMTFSLASDLNAGLKRLLEVAMQIGGLDAGGVYLLNEATGGMDLAVARGSSPAFVEAVSHWAADGPQMSLVRSGRPIFGRYEDLPVPKDEVRHREGMRATAFVPLHHNSKPVGVLALSSHETDEIPLPTQLTIEAIAAQAAGAITRIRAEEALRESENRLRAIITGAPVLLFAVDQDGIIRFEDGQGLAALGATRGANVGRSVMEVYTHLPTLRENARRALRGEQFEAIVESGLTVFDCWYSPTRDKDGKSTGYIGVATNISERHQLERQILEISDREHARIGQDIHDGLCQHLVSLGFDANSLQGQLTSARRPEAKTARRIADYLDRAITEARQLSRGLFPVRLAKEGLPPALEEMAATTRDRFKIRCRFASQGPVAVESSVTATHLYRIAQEAVRNAVKHSRASSVAIRLRARAGALELSVTDNGVGLPDASRNTQLGMGLQIMDYRARTIGGTLQIGPGSRGGTKVSCCVPASAGKESGL